MKLSKAEVEHIASLARLSLTEEEKERYRIQLSSILDHISQLQEIDTSDISALTSVWDNKMIPRLDDPHQGLTTEKLLDNAPETAREQFKVPPILDGKDE